jgi:methylenetetrahydrofolate reductase (NADPH)
MSGDALDLASLDLEEIAAMRRALLHPKFEILPLKSVYEQLDHLPDGATVSVTASPQKGMGATIDFAVELSERGFDAVPHLSAHLIEDRRELAGILGRLDAARIHKAFVVGGDGEQQGQFEDGAALLTAMSSIGNGLAEIGFPGYPEGHHVADDATMERALEAKAPYASYVTSQMCFAPDAIKDWVHGLRRTGSGLGVYVGIAGVAELAKLLTLSLRIGVGPSARFLSKNRGLAGRLVRPGGYSPDQLLVGIAALLADPVAGVLGFHIYTFNRIEPTEQWRLEMLDALA